MNDHLLARQARRYAAVFVCLLGGFLLLGPSAEPAPEADTAALPALGLAAAAFIMARRRN